MVLRVQRVVVAGQPAQVQQRGVVRGVRGSPVPAAVGLHRLLLAAHGEGVVDVQRGGARPHGATQRQHHESAARHP